MSFSCTLFRQCKCLLVVGNIEATNNITTNKTERNMSGLRVVTAVCRAVSSQMLGTDIQPNTTHICNMTHPHVRTAVSVVMMWIVSA